MIKYSCDTNINKIPKNTTHLTFEKFNNISISNIITYLTFGYWFSKQLCNLPRSIIHLTFGYYFNYSVDNLPNSIVYLTFGYKFNKSVNNLPNSITHLTFGNDFNQPVDNLPCSITHLTFGYNFNQSVDNLPHSITHLTFGQRFNQPVDNLPHSITQLTLESTLYFKQHIHNLPNSITHLIFTYCFIDSLDMIINDLKINKSVKVVKFFKIYDMDIGIMNGLSNKYVIYNDINYVYYKLNGFSVSYHYSSCVEYGLLRELKIREQYQQKIEIVEQLLNLQYFVHEILFKKLTEYVFNPQRLLKISKIYNLTIDEYMDFL